MISFVLAAVLITPPPSSDVQYRQPQLAADDEHVVVTFGAKNDIFVAISNDDGRRFARPISLPNSGIVSLGMHRGPRVAMDSGSIIISAIVGKKGKGEDGDLLSWRSHDTGRTWSGPVHINEVEGSAREGLHSMASRDGIIYTAWLDLRSKGTKIYGSASRDGGGTWSKNVLVYQSPDGSVCECCHPTVVVGAHGVIYVMFRNNLDNARDMYLITSTDYGKSFGEPVKLGAGSWVLNACPMDGGDLGIDRKGRAAAIYRRDGEIFVASDDSSETKIGEGKDASIAVSPLGPYFSAWTGADGLFLLRPGSSAPVLLDKQGRYIQLHNSRGRVYATWEKEGTVVVETLR